MKINTFGIVRRVFLACLTSAAAWAQSGADSAASSQLAQFSSSIQNLTSRVAPSVVRILVTRYGSAEENGRTELIAGKQESIGSGVIVDPSGYIVTNAHVVQGAQKIRVNLLRSGDQTIQSIVAHPYVKPLDANLVGTFKEGDLALIKVAGNNLPALPLADYGKLRQGEIVFALGSPAGLQNSVSMGVVSSIARQPDPDSPFIFIQTDTPINPGNSGGPLVNAAGEVVGLNTFILSQSGGNEGVGFAIPSMLIKWVWPELRKHGHVDRTTMGVGLQAITPVLASALKLPLNSGVLISDVTEDGPAASAGIKVNDILVSMNGQAIDSVPSMLGFFFEHRGGTQIKVEVKRGGELLSFDVVPIEEKHQTDRLADLADPTQNLIPVLGFVGVTVDKTIESLLGSMRLPTGVVMITKVQTPTALDSGLQPGDVVHSVNGDFVYNIDALKNAIGKGKPGDPMALLIERQGQLQYVAFEIP